MADEVEGQEEMKGLVNISLQRNSKQIKSDRAAALGEDLEIAFKRKCEDLNRDLRQATRNRDNMFDFSPTNSQSLVLARDIDAYEISNNDMEFSLKIRDIEIKYKIAVERYETLFGKQFND